MKTRSPRGLLTLLALLLAVCPWVTGAQEAPTHSSKPVAMMGELVLKPGREKEFLALFTQMKARATHQDRGNLRYELFTVAPATDHPSAPKMFVFLEEWDDQAAFTAHGKWAGPIVRSQWKDMTSSMKMMRLNSVSVD